MKSEAGWTVRTWRWWDSTNSWNSTCSTGWSRLGNTEALNEKGQSCLHPLMRLWSFGVCITVRMFYQSVVGSAIFYMEVCCGIDISAGDANRLNKLIKNAVCYRRQSGLSGGSS